MKLLAILGTYRKGRTIDTLVDRALAGAAAAAPGLTVDRIHLVDQRIEYCRNCMVCRGDDPAREVASCPIDDDLNPLLPLLQEADALLLATPINCGTVTAVMKTFLERTCWTLARPGAEPLEGCPVPRSGRSRRAAIILSSGIVPPELREACDDATGLITSHCECCFNAAVVDTLYAGAVERVGVESYGEAARALGARLVS